MIRAEVKIIDDDKPETYNEKPYLINPNRVDTDGFVHKYVFEFDYYQAREELLFKKGLWNERNYDSNNEL